MKDKAATPYCRGGRRLAVALAFLLPLTSAGTATAFDWERPAGEEPRIYCNAPEKGTVSRGRVYAVSFFTDGAPRAERSYACSIRHNASSPYKPEISSVMNCTYVSGIAGSDYTLNGQESSQSLFQSNIARDIFGHAYGKHGIWAQKKP